MERTVWVRGIGVSPCGDAPLWPQAEAKQEESREVTEAQTWSRGWTLMKWL